MCSLDHLMLTSLSASRNILSVICAANTLHNLGASSGAYCANCDMCAAIRAL